jgi:predicted dehydrogenase
VWARGAPVEVRATAHQLYGTLEDELQAMMTLADGTEVGFDSSWSVPGYPRPSTVIEAEGENGKLLVSDEALELELRHAAGTFRSGLTRLRESDLPRPARLDLAGEGLWLQDAAFLDWLAGGVAPPNEAGAALATQRVMDALYRSSAADGTTVEVTR